MTHITSITVTFYPDVPLLRQQLKALSVQVDQLLVIGNAADECLHRAMQALAQEFSKLIWLPQSQNLGIASAQNIGIRYALEHGADYILLMDQDSAPYPDMVEQLRMALEAAEQTGRQIAVAGACCCDPRTTPPTTGCFIRIENGQFVRLDASNNPNAVQASYVIASGSLIPVKALQIVGLMQEELFIDYVDTEWGLRATHLGWESIGVFSARMEHRIGDQHIRFCGRQLTVHSPIRHYYMFRNAIWLYQHPDLPSEWKKIDSIRLLIRLVAYLALAPRRWERCKYIVRGIWHGLRGIMGPYV